MDTFLTIASKRDQRSYAPEAVPGDVLERVLEAGRVSGSAMNRQDRRFIVLTDVARTRAASMVTRSTNLERATAAVAVVTGSGSWADFDAGRAAQNMMLMGAAVDQVASRDSLSDPTALDWFVDLARRQEFADQTQSSRA